MKKITIISFVLVAIVLAGAAVASAQTYIFPVNTGGYTTPYPGQYAAPYQSAVCMVYTSYQMLGSTDGSTGGQVTPLQQMLNREGYLSGVSGTFDLGTLGAVFNYQRTHGIFPTGTVGPVTRQALNQEGCAGTGIGYGYVPPTPTPNIPPVWNQPNPCFSGYYNTYSNCQTDVRITSISSSYSNNRMVVNVKGYGFSSDNNTVNYGGTIIPNVSSSNTGTSISFVVPVNYQGTYYNTSSPVSVTNFGGYISNTISFVPDYNQNNQYGQYDPYGNPYGWQGNQYQNGTPVISSITGPTNLQTGNSSVWAVTASDQYGQNMTITTNWGDGSSVDTRQAYGVNQNSYSFPHTYTNSGTYTIRITATDSSGRNAYSTLTVQVSGSNYHTNYYYPYQNSGY
jgi:peptidoglycan hydrolase-like protein with peptidoglycan-binding domain